MFTFGAFILLMMIAYVADRSQRSDRQDGTDDIRDNEMRRIILYVRQDLRLVAFLLGGILIALGVIADRIH